MHERLTAQQRVRLAQELRKQANQPGLSQKQRQDRRRASSNLMKINEYEARKKAQTGARSWSSTDEQEPSDGLPGTVGVPFRGGGEAVNLILSGTVPIGFFGGANFAPYVQDGRMIALAVDADKRSPLYPNTPTLAELGFRDKFSRPYLSLVVPAKTPPDIILTLNQAIADVMSRPDFLKRHLLDRGLESIADTPQQATRFLAEDRGIVKNLVGNQDAQDRRRRQAV
jgi:hypothetical protein